MPRTNWGWEITPEELRSWIVLETEELLAVNKPAHVVCHPSKFGPWSSLVGAARELLGLERVHLPSRLDRETSGIVILTRNWRTASRLQRAAEKRRVRKTYYAILCGEMAEPRTVCEPLGRDTEAVFGCRQWVRPEDGKPAETEFFPLARGGGYTLARVVPRSGRLHQIRVHASWMGHAVAGDKLYGPDPALMLEFLRDGYSKRVAEALPLPRHALHAAKVVFLTRLGEEAFRAPFAADLAQFWREHAGVPLPDALL